MINFARKIELKLIFVRYISIYVNENRTFKIITLSHFLVNFVNIGAFVVIVDVGFPIAAFGYIWPGADNFIKGLTTFFCWLEPVI